MPVTAMAVAAVPMAAVSVTVAAIAAAAACEAMPHMSPLDAAKPFSFYVHVVTFQSESVGKSPEQQ